MDKRTCCVYTMNVTVLFFVVDDTCFPQHKRIRRRRQIRLQVNHTTLSAIKPEIEIGSLEIMNWRGAIPICKGVN